VTVIRPRKGWQAVDLRELWRYRELLYFLAWRDLKVRYKQTVIGAGWAVLQPVLTMVIFSIIFGRFAKMPTDGSPYPIFVYAGLLPWTFFANSVAKSSMSLVSQTHLFTKTYFPRLLLPTAGIAVGLVDFALSFTVYIALMLWYGHVPGMSVLLLPLFVTLAATLALGVGYILSALTVAYRDFKMAVPFLLQAWMFASPVIYPVTLLPEKYRWVLAVNPMTGIIGSFRSVLLNQPVDWPAVGVSAVVASAVFVSAVYGFRRMELRFADIA